VRAAAVPQRGEDPGVEADPVPANHREEERHCGDRQRADPEDQRMDHRRQSGPGGIEEQGGHGKDDQLPPGQTEGELVSFFDVSGYAGA
jgi:hypothetical protein